VLHLICVQRKDRKAGIPNRQNEMLETLCSLFPIDCRLPKLNVAGSIPVSRSKNQQQAARDGKPRTFSAPGHPIHLPVFYPERRSP
jgi:hypothetical protein